MLLLTCSRAFLSNHFNLLHRIILNQSCALTSLSPLSSSGSDFKTKLRALFRRYARSTINCHEFALIKSLSLSLAQFERKLFTNFHRQVFCWMDKWHGLTMQDIRELEEQTRQLLDEVRRRSVVVHGSNSAF